MEDNKQDAAGRISFFLETFFTTIEALEVSFYITKDCKIIIQDNQTGLSSIFTSEEFQREYIEWAEKVL